MKASRPRMALGPDPAESIAGILAALLEATAVLPVQVLDRVTTQPPPPLAFMTPFPRLSVVLAGEHAMDVPQPGTAATLIARPLEVVFIPSGSWNRPCWSSPVRLLELLFGSRQIGFSLVDHTAATSEPRGAIKAHVHLLRNSLVQHLLQCLQQTSSATPTPLRSLLVTSLLHAAADLLRQPVGPVLSKAQRTYAEACLYIQTNLHQPLCRDDVARELAISGTYLSRLFQREGGIQFTEYVRSLRIQYAQHLLGHHRLPLKQVAANCGYHDLAYFCRVFKQTTGLTPTGYRNQHTTGR